MNALYRLTYYSNNKIIGKNSDVDAEIYKILEKSRENNILSNITGALLFNRECFSQILEGPYDEIERTFERIQRDERHNDVVPLEFSAVPERGFSIWSMAYVSRALNSQSRPEGGNSGLDPRKLTSDEIFDRLYDLVLEQEMSLKSV